MADALSPLARALGPENARALLPQLEPVTLPAGEHLLVQGEPSSWLYLLTDGEVRVFVHGPNGREDLGARGPGSWLGEVGVIDGGPATATVEVGRPSRLLRIDRAALARLTVEQPEVVAALLRHLVRQLAERLVRTSAGQLESDGPGQLRVFAQPEGRLGRWVRRLTGKR
jgi:CRP-like cAMP-binding protein